MDEQFQIQFMPSDSMLSIRSPLRYKYKPTIRYSVELYRNPGVICRAAESTVPYTVPAADSPASELLRVLDLFSGRKVSSGTDS